MIRGTIGRGGSGKTLSTIARLWHLFKTGRDIVSNTPLIDLRVRYVEAPFGWMWVPVDTATFGKSWASAYVHRFEDVYDLENCEVLIDEMGAWMPSDQHRSMPEEIRRFLSQDRREGVNVWWTHRTTKVFHQVRDNTSDLARCSRYGPFIVAESADPETPDEKPVKKYYRVDPNLYDLYDTYARVGSATTGEGYGVGNRAMYGGGEAVAYYECVLPCVNGGHVGCKIRLRPGQAEALTRMYGFEAVGLYRDDLCPGSWGVSRWRRDAPQVPGLPILNEKFYGSHEEHRRRQEQHARAERLRRLEATLQAIESGDDFAARESALLKAIEDARNGVKRSRK
jgi:hypothetical protein